MTGRDIYVDNQELRVLSLIEEIFRNEYVKEQDCNKKKMIKNKFVEIKFRIKNNLEMSFCHEHTANLYISNISRCKLWNEPENIFLL